MLVEIIFKMAYMTSKIIDKGLELKIEDSSDDFFKSKHIEKRKQQLIIERTNIIHKLETGLDKIETAYRNNDGKMKEKLFLELLSKLHVDKIFYQDEYRNGYFLLDSNNGRKCFYDLKNDYFLIDYLSIWKPFKIRFDVTNDILQSFVDYMIKKYFNFNVVDIMLYSWP